jgi:LysR family hydrogen peroxide-inducible transcriptional activator
LFKPSGHQLKEHVLAICNISTNETNTLLVSNSLHTSVQMVAGKMGTTLAPAMALEQIL